MRSRGELPLLHRRVDDDDPAGLALMLLIDRTGSMGGTPHPIDWVAGGKPGPAFETGRMPHARRAAILLDMACTAAEIPLCIGYAGNEGSTVHHPHGVSGFVRDTPVIWVREWTTPRAAEGPRALLAGMYGDSGDECYSASLRLAQARLRDRPEPTKVIIYLLDGRPTDETTDAVRCTGVRATEGRRLIVTCAPATQKTLFSMGTGAASAEAVRTYRRASSAAGAALPPEQLLHTALAAYGLDLP